MSNITTEIFYFHSLLRIYFTMKSLFSSLTSIALLLLFSYSVSAQNNFWKDILESKVTANKQRKIIPKHYRTLLLDTARLTSFFTTVPGEFTEAAKKNPVVITLPMPDGSFNRFRMTETSMMEPQLAAQFPDIKTYSGQGVDDPYATIKLDWSVRGLHAMILSPVNGSVYIDPYVQETLTNYICYNKKDVRPRAPFMENGHVVSEDVLNKPLAARQQQAQCIGGTLRRYRLAIACTGEYAKAVGGASVTTAQAVSAIVTTINRVNGIYESELDIRLVIINNNTRIVFTDSARDPFTGNNDGNILLDESQSAIDRIIGANNYDIGHTLSTGSGGLAKVGVVCLDGEKASGVTGNSPPSGDPFDVDYVAHEMGHEFGANHTFAAETGNCSGNGNASSNAEPGSGSTIMGYAGICDPANDLQPNSDPYFHAVSFNEITDYTINGPGNDCAVQIPTGNTPPVVNAGGNYTIPGSTPFVLTGSATDVDKDSLTYCWEEINTGGPFGSWNRPEGDAPIFRSFPPAKIPVRFFPKMSDILNNATTIGEILPSYSRTLNFRLTARDNRAGGGGVCFGEMSVAVDGNSGPFAVTGPDTATTWDVSTFKMITWNVNNTNTAPVSCANVAIELSVDGGQTFPVTLLASTPNDGAEEIIVPDNITTAARIRVRAVGNIFFDVSNIDFKIQPFTFTAAKDVNNTVNVQWAAINEIDSLRYEIERSLDGVTFDLLGKVNAGDNPDSLQQYLFNDDKPYQGVNYYRLKQINKDGRFIYSKIVSVGLEKTGVQYVVFPNPAVYSSTIRILADMNQVTVRFIDALGRRVFAKTFSTLKIGEEIKIPLAGLSSGVYFLTLTSDTGTSSHKVFVHQ